jgi:hypothetical protein
MNKWFVVECCVLAISIILSPVFVYYDKDIATICNGFFIFGYAFANFMRDKQLKELFK